MRSGIRHFAVSPRAGKSENVDTDEHELDDERSETAEIPEAAL